MCSRIVVETVISMKTIRFGEIDDKVPRESPGIYEIHTDSGIPLKVGVAKDIKERLRQHRSSADKYLEWMEGSDRTEPGHATSKRSILAKHLFFDESITTEFDLKTEIGRQRYLAERCHIRFRVTQTRDEALNLEGPMEKEGVFRYVGAVRRR